MRVVLAPCAFPMTSNTTNGRINDDAYNKICGFALLSKRAATRLRPALPLTASASLPLSQNFFLRKGGRRPRRGARGLC